MANNDIHKRNVGFTKDKVLKMKNGILTHNHPQGWKAPEKSILRIGNSFSKEDITLSIVANLSEVRAVTPHYTFTLKRPENGWPDLKLASEQYDSLNKELSTQFRAMIDKSTNGQLTVDRANTIHFHIVAKNFSKHFGIEYTRQNTR